MTKTLVGHVGVDAGLIMVGDPCYFWPNDNGEPNEVARTGLSWLGMCDKLKDTDYDHLQLDYALGHAGLGVVVGTTNGDGTYPVYIKESADGRRTLIVELD